jgi:cyclopropane fatty-acyl-phospholipid synthase-like methyltransferase
MAARADRHRLYERSVQCAEAEIDFVDTIFRKLRHRTAFSLREDFCGTANNACEWVHRRRRNRAYGVDLDAEVLAWGSRHNIGRLRPAERRRIELLRADVMRVRVEPVDVILAMNFSYWIFKERAILRRYFRRARAGLVEDGVLFIDAFGGYDAFRVLREKTKFANFTYIWDQAYYNPVNGDLRCHIHFRFKDGSRLRRAFTYDWRLWTLPELTEILCEAGFARTTVYWQRDDEAADDENEFEPVTEGDADAGWIAYLVAEK